MKLPIPGEQTFVINNNPYNKAAYIRLCNEFGISYNSDAPWRRTLPLADFRWKGGRNNGLGDIFIDYGNRYGATDHDYQNVHVIRNYDKEADMWPSSGDKFSDDGGKKIEGNLISFLRNDDFSDFKYAWFIPTSGHGVTKSWAWEIK